MEIRNTPAPLELHRQKTFEELPAKKEISRLDHEKTRLRKAAREFESFFLASMLKSMRATVPKSSEDSNVPGGGLGKDMYQDMFDIELSKKMAERSSGGIGDILYKTLVGRIEAEFRDKPEPLSLSETPAKAHSAKTLTGHDLRKSEASE